MLKACLRELRHCSIRTEASHGLAQASLQNFAWTEDHRARVCAERAAQGGSEAQRAAVLAEPVFCFETACKALYWSMLVYRLQARRPRAGRDSA